MSALLLTTIHSGFQTGSDMGGILAAKDLGLQTGGVMPRGFRTEDGDRPEYADLYGAKEHRSRDYGPRTTANVRDTDATVVCSRHPESSGSLATAREARYFGRPCVVNPTPEGLVAFLHEHGVVTVNIAGNRESVAPGIEANVRAFLTSALRPHLP